MQKDIIAKRIREARKEFEYTQDELAQRINISRTTLANYEEGRRSPSFDVLFAIANELNISVFYLFGLESELVNNDEYTIIRKLFNQIGYDLIYDAETNSYTLKKDKFVKVITEEELLITINKITEVIKELI